MRSHDVSGSSFRDPSGFIFTYKGEIFRQINYVYKEHYEALMTTGLYHELVSRALLVSHEEVFIDTSKPELCYKIIKPIKVPFISYPYEWSFSQLKDAALLTLEVQNIALKYGLILKDANGFNVQFLRGKPIFIDTLSFEKYVEGSPWVAYRQFCQHFLSPLALMSLRDVRLNQLLKDYLDGIPLDLASKLLPKSSWLNFSLALHIHLHALNMNEKSIKHSTIKTIDSTSLFGLLDNLKSTITKLSWKPEKTAWLDYYNVNKYSNDEFLQKKSIVREYVHRIQPKIIWDLGSNIGIFSRLASNNLIDCISVDIDPSCVEMNYLHTKENHEEHILPLCVDLINPSPDTGWNNEERTSFLSRGRADLILCLGLMHHLIISNNIPLDLIMEFFSKMSNHLIIEFIPVDDPQAQRLLKYDRIFHDYSKDKFETIFQEKFSILDHQNVENSGRIIYLMENRRNKC